jgi:AraC-like DNA-binding protein
LNILCYLPSPALVQVQRALPSPHSIANAATWEVFVARVGRRECDIAIVDPCYGGEHRTDDRMHALASAVAGTPRAPVVGYVAVTAAAIRATHALTKLGASDVLIRGMDDGPAALSATLRSVVASTAANQFLRVANHAMAALPAVVARGVEQAFEHPERFHSVSQLAQASASTRRSLDRWLARVGMAPARTLLACARAHAAFNLLATGHVRVAATASQLGYPSTRALSRELHAVTGHPARSIGTALPPDAMIALLQRQIMRRG